MSKLELNANEQIYDAIRQIAYHKFANPRTGVVKNTNKIPGYVVKFHSDPSDALYGTVDVQEYNRDTAANQQAIERGAEVGLHKGVYLSAIQNNERGIIVIPFLYSDVIIETDPETLNEYVVQYSHADTIQLDSHNKISIGVTETNPYEDTEDSPDADELEKTGVHAHTTYTPVSALTVVGRSDKPQEQSSLEVTADKIEAIRDKTSLLLDAQQLLAKYNTKEIVIKEDGVYLGSGNATEPAVLGNQLATLLIDWLGTLSQMMTPTMMGPQPPANVAKFVALQSKVNAYKSSVSGFLSKTVKVEK